MTTKTLCTSEEDQAPGREKTASPDPSETQDRVYEIRVRDHLDTYWWSWFEGWTITNLENGEVLLVRSGIDQSALHGVLNLIRDLNLTLLSVTRLGLAPVERDPAG